MRGATESARKLKRAFSSLRSNLGKVQRPPPTDPITQLLLGTFSRNQPENRARETVEQLRALVVDYNELRVIPVGEMADAIEAKSPDLWRKCEDLSRALNAIFAAEHAVSLERVRGLPRKDAKAYLDQIRGLEPYTRARIRLLGFEWHAIPLDEAMWAFCQREELVDPKGSLEDSQAFLERQIEESDALEFVALLKKQAWSDLGGAVKRGQTIRVESMAPDRKSTNMLQAIAGGAALQEPDLDLDEEELDLETSESSPKKKPGKAGGGARKPKPKSKANNVEAKPKASNVEAKSKPARPAAERSAAVATKPAKPPRAGSKAVVARDSEFNSDD